MALELGRRRPPRLLLVGREHRALTEVADATGGTALEADLADPAGLTAVAAAGAAADVVVHAAGIGWAGDLATMSAEEARRLLEVDLWAPIELTRAILPGMLARRRGHLVFLGSIAGAVGVPGEATYSAAKAGIGAFAEVVRAETAGRGVGVSTVLPGVVDTPFFTRRGRPYDRRWPRPVPPERVARAVVRAIERNRAEMFVPAWLRLPARLHGAAPPLYGALARRLG
ncbi:Oxidoreductase, short-chain dehydrogenase/reductase family [Blastococcus saxobsidens DD2]|uniref:Oxidoreductase, short-chain dehydrogenase/reductase family n=1 Tax=Blastococcus saxobsidens (strain DD2) TaxID=1146883 RepID=H6RL65_BLASD|nr:Oxidoreductase, short-chain dehydrogenase/reductase family [Blastococcus saxobsidens DD2]